MSTLLDASAATPSRLEAAVYIGRFQPLHDGHLALLRHALSLAPRCVVVIGSAYQARTPRNPFTWQERAEMVKLALPAADRERLHFLPMRDYYDDTRWVGAVRQGVERLLVGLGQPAHAAVALVGHFKDATSEYLRAFPGWRLESQERVGTVDGRHLRDALFSTVGHPLDTTLAALAGQAPPSTLDFLRAWAALPFLPALAEEWRQLKAYREAWAQAPYPPVLVTVDTVVRCRDRVLLVQRAQPPGKGLYAVPGGFIEQRETAYQSALRELKEETRLSLLDSTMRDCLQAAVVFDHPDRSQRGRTITHAHYFDLGERELPEVQGGDDAARAEWVPIAQLPAMEDRFLDDHFHMLDHFLGLTPR
ncbi:bifunctional nicotinamide-nucleotide adenylyltransferase/Nudix hydroxylase [Aquabacterium sp. A7-Y]|uniref:bifunctional nicotinamide-nucleotide adenylyltransferase/Nudix hydroxylase n=1 Tax=Aquabacterium sp. A7-Y TaxID=1349605 RepID=UPI00223DA5CB|nr:bifunctional nicotinamide-nucleotide adenylyltransferase/Nudix hydroxylase [Aquabacterium sp. A7-Y]MCW7539250.1 bifunctional nicotinamide-nucleotide adenylyltransferase/Nudix hydroxylase [Aquabacterium sp. A7-Y]